METQKRLITKSFPIVRMDCPTCIPAIENEVKRVKGVTDARGSYMTKTLKVTYDPEAVEVSQIEAAIERVGYQIAYKKYPGVLTRIRGMLHKEKLASVQNISDEEFQRNVIDASKPVAVLFSSPTCPTCMALRPTLVESVESLGVKIDLYEMDIASSETWRRYDVTTIPTVLVFRDGDVARRLTSIPDKGEIMRALTAVNPEK